MLLLAGTLTAQTLTPESPQVKRLLVPALEFLDRDGGHARLGGKCLVALALLKGDRPPNHPRIQAAAKAATEAATTLEQKHTADVIYDLGLAIIFLCELDAEQYRPEIKALVDLLRKWQKPHGGWGYLQGTHVKTGDTSMTQYAVLSLWTAHTTRAYPLDEGTIRDVEEVCNWLIRTQDPSGGWGYQGQDPGIGNYQRIPQFDVQHSLSAAGCGSVYICADLLGLTRRVSGRDPSLPSAVSEVRQTDSDSDTRGPLGRQVDPKRLQRALQDGNRWFERNFRINPQEWKYYYMYALERYQSFRALAGDGQLSHWYETGVNYLASAQGPNGAWDADAGPVADTCFAVMFLTRGTQKSIRRMQAYSGRLRGGRGLPSQLTNVTVGEDGQVVKSPFQGKAESLLAILEAGQGDNLDELPDTIEIQLSDDPLQRQRELERLRRLASADEYAVRMAALSALASTRELENVPVFIYALGDPDPRIVRKARDTLRLLSRRIEGFGLSDDPSEGEKLEAIEKWKRWYLSVNADAQFLN